MTTPISNLPLNHEEWIVPNSSGNTVRLSSVPVQIPIKILSDKAKVPTKAYPTDLGWDLYAMEETRIKCYSNQLIPLGFEAAIPDGFGMLFRDRSSLALKGITVSAGVVDSTYRGEWKVLLRNNTPLWYTIGEGDRIAQAILIPNYTVGWSESSTLPPTVRDKGGFGSTGA